MKLILEVIQVLILANILFFWWGVFMVQDWMQKILVLVFNGSQPRLNKQYYFLIFYLLYLFLWFNLFFHTINTIETEIGSNSSSNFSQYSKFPILPLYQHFRFYHMVSPNFVFCWIWSCWGKQLCNININSWFCTCLKI